MYEMYLVEYISGYILTEYKCICVNVEPFEHIWCKSMSILCLSNIEGSRHSRKKIIKSLEAKRQSVSQNIKVCAETSKREQNHQRSSQNVIVQAKTSERGPKRQSASQNVRVQAKMSKQELKCQSESKNVKTRGKMSKRELKHERES